MIITLNQIGINASSLVLPSGRKGLFSNEDLVAVYDGVLVHHIADLYRRPLNSVRHVEQWIREMGFVWPDVLQAAPLELERILLDNR